MPNASQTILQFINSAGAVTLNLNDMAGFVLARGLDLGAAEVETTWLSQPPYPGAIPTGFTEQIVTMQIPIQMSKQTNWLAMRSLLNLLHTELLRPTNIIEFKPDPTSASYYFDTYRASIPSLYRGLDAPNPARLKQDPFPMLLQIPRHPQARGASVYV